MKKNTLDIKRIALVSVLLALAITIDIVTGFIPGLNASLPLGGRILNISLLPIMLIGLFTGPLYGVIGAVIYGIFGYFADGYALSFFADNLVDALIVFLLDYIIAFGALGLVGVFKKALDKPIYFVVMSLSALLIRWLSATIVGAILWISYATSNSWTNSILEGVGNNAFIYSGIYNLAYTIPTFIVINVIVVLAFKQLRELKENFQLY